MRRRLALPAFLLLACLPLAPLAAGEEAASLLDGPLIRRALGMIERQYGLPLPPPTELAEGAIEGMLARLNVRERPAAARSDETERENAKAAGEWNRLLPPERLRLLNQELAGSFAGIGARIELDGAGGAIRLKKVLPGSPSLAAGLRDGDLVVAIDGKEVKGLTLPEAVSRLRGRRGSPIWLRVRRDGALQDFRFRRDIVRVPSAEGRVFDDGTAYLRISSFHRGTRAALSVLLKGEAFAAAKGLVLDLRGNPGGNLDAAVAAAGFFLEAKTLVVTTKAKEGKQELRATGPRLWTKPVVCLVDGDSASGAEIVAAALRGAGAALLAGRPTFGKTTAQTLFELPGGYGLKLTTASFAPAAPPVDGRIHPDVLLPEAEKADGETLPSLETVHDDPWVRSARAMLGLSR